MTTEEKAKRYAEAIEKGKQIQNTPYTAHWDIMKEVAEYLLPELKESEDESIRKAIHIYLDWLDGRKDYAPKGEYSIRDMIAWLEKQGKKPNNVCDKELSEILGRVICRYINDPNIPYTEREKVSMEIIPYVERLEKQGEQKPIMIQWNGNNLKEVINFTGFYKEGFEKWFHNSWEEYEKYVHEHGNIFKMFNEDGSHIEVPVGAWIVKTPDGYNTASRYVFKQNPAWSEEDEVMIKVFDSIIRYIVEVVDKNVLERFGTKSEELFSWLKSLKERYTWKPSDCQMESLKLAIYGEAFRIDELQKLYDQLKAL